ncbi:hypothetical protein ACX93W_21045 [Paenibacillus sp. CAU 1782]
MPYPDEVDVFKPKLNKRTDGTAYTVQEELPLTDGKFEGLLAHDNIANSSIRAHTGPNMTGVEVTAFTVSIPADTPWRRYIRIFADADVVYATYQTPGDQVDADDINELQTAATATQEELNRYKSTTDARVGAVEHGKADKTVVDSQFITKADKSSVYTKSETDQRIQTIVGAAPDALDTLQEIADALNNDPDFAGTMTVQLAGKVDKVAGKGLSANDYTTAEKTKLAGIAAGANNYAHPATHPPAIIAQDANNRFVSDTEKSAWNAKAEKAAATVEGDGLMSAADKSKLDGIAAGANNYSHPATHPPSIITQDSGNRFVTDGEKAAWNAKAETAAATTSANGLMSAGDKSKLDGIAAGANNYSHPATHPPSVIAQDSGNRFVTDTEKTAWNAKASAVAATSSANGLMSAADKTKLDGISAGAQVNRGLSTQTQAEAGEDHTTDMTPLRVKQAIDKRLSGVGAGDMLKSVYDSNDNGKVDQAEAADSVPWSGVSGKPTTFSPSAHSHDALNVKADNWKQGDALPSTYDRGLTVFFSNNPTSRFNGVQYCTIMTVKGYSSMAAIQYLYPYNINAPIYYRLALYNSDNWLPWRQMANYDDVMPKGPLTWGQLRGDA